MPMAKHPAPAPDPIRLIIQVPARKLAVYRGNTLLKTYSVGLGRKQFPTPVGSFKVIRKLENPGWENPYLGKGEMVVKPGANNPLGTRWIGFKEDAKGEYGIHGTNRPDSVGKFSSHGCVRMRIADAEAVYALVQVGTPVDVRYDRVEVVTRQGQLQVTVHPDYLGLAPLPPFDKTLKRIAQEYPRATIDPVRLKSALQTPTGTPVLLGRSGDEASVSSGNNTPVGKRGP
jgi:hypothetical protein